MTIKNDPRDQAGYVSGMFGRISGWYDFLNHFLSLGMDILWRRKLVKAVRPGPTGRFLDLAAGTMDVTRELKRLHPDARILAMDFSLPMLERGRPKLAAFGNDVLPVLADGRLLPLADQSVDAVTIAFGIRNIRPRSAAYAEILRTLAPGGRLAILEFGSSNRPIWKGLYNFYLNTLLPLVGRVVSKDRQAYKYLAETIADFPTAPALEEELREAGFVNLTHEELLSGIVNIHVAERRFFDGQTFVVGARPGPVPKQARASRAPKPPATDNTAPSADARADAEAEAQAETGQGATRRAANLEAGLRAMDKAIQSGTQASKTSTKKAAASKTKAVADSTEGIQGEAGQPAATQAGVQKTAPKAAKKKSPVKKSTQKKSSGKKTAAGKATPKQPSPKKAAPKRSGPKKGSDKK